MTEPQFTTEELNSEEWKLIPGYNSRYEISNLGRLRSLSYHGKPRVKVLRLPLNANGYAIATLYEDLRPRAIGAHILVANAFCVRANSDQKQVNHIDLNKANNRAVNLEWCTAKENTAHRVAHGHVGRGETHGSRTKPERVPRGERHGSKTKPHCVARGDRSGMRRHPESVRRGSKNGSAKLTESVVIAIREAFSRMGSYRAVARQFKLSETNATRIIKRQSWKHVP